MRKRHVLSAIVLTCLLLLGSVGCGVSGAPGSIGSGGKNGAQVRQGGDSVAPEAGKPGELPTEDNGFLVEEPVGEPVVLDLDGDGQQDTLELNREEMQRGMASDTWTEPVLSSLRVNGKELADPQSKDSLGDYGVRMVRPETDRFFITDLDTGDHALEIALLDAGVGGDAVTWYFHYRNGELIPVGCLPGCPDDEVSRRDGSGNVMAEGRLSLLQTWHATFSYALREDRLEEVPQSWYIPLQEFQNVVTLKQALTLYASPDLKSETVTVKPSEEPVTFPTTDNVHWVQMCLTGRTAGWLYMEDPVTVRSSGERFRTMDVFDNLNQSE